MSCPQDHALSAYADQEMRPAEYAKLARHVQGCPVCQRRLAQFEGLRQAMRELPSPALGFDLSARLKDRLRPAPQSIRARPRFWTGWVPAGLGTGLALASGVWLGSLLVGGGGASAPGASMVRVFDPVPPGGLCAAAEICRLSKAMP